MKSQAELYQPTLGALGIANPLENPHRFPMRGEASRSGDGEQIGN